MGVISPPQIDFSDLELIRKWQSGDNAAASRLVERHADPLVRFVSSLGEREGAFELMQDTFVRAFGAIDGFRGESSFRTWLFTIARRLILDRRRAEKRRPATEALEEGDVVTQFDALDTLLADEAMMRVRAAVDSLSAKQSEVFLLRVEQGLSFKEIAAVVDSTEGATRVHYHNALRSVKDYLNE